ncbi:MAG: 1-deoxy-D-xylulose-5-phosphate reductoisomerase [Thermoguttaceae bacterium]|nr:1-deoxy-D-xylulose-5-phosphate reductoisomerase [Thermoguttaceae bacterium]MDW8037490.1 1-deoxy-D-xylulose-5-phosphate reductoisomerase [Thermoguttaceae bacterium]
MTEAPAGTKVRGLALLGSTGSIGRNTLEVVAASEGRLKVVALSAHRNTALLKAQAQQFRPGYIVVTDPEAAARQDWSGLPAETQLRVGHNALIEVVQLPEVDIVLVAIVGRAGLEGTWAALDASKTVALANKESLVIAGPLVTRLAAQRGARILPVDSEHSAVFQALQAGRRQEVRRVLLTASGGPFRSYPLERLHQVTVQEALAHPTWNMGPKITIDSATLMNKALEIIEARWLFELAPHQIGVLIHPQSIIHSMVEYIDGSVIAQMSPPDMRLPIQYALFWPDRQPAVARQFDWSEAYCLEFYPPDPERHVALQLGIEVAQQGGTAGAVLNGANEAAVAAFLEGKIPFTYIVPACRAVVEHHPYDPNPSLETLLRLDRWARQEVQRWVCSKTL